MSMSKRRDGSISVTIYLLRSGADASQRQHFASWNMTC